MKIPGLSFSTKRASGVTTAQKQEKAGETGALIAKQSQERKIGVMMLNKLKEKTSSMADAAKEAAEAAKAFSTNAAEQLSNKIGDSASAVGDYFSKTPDAIAEFGKNFSESDLWKKVAEVASKVGQNLLYIVLVLFHGVSDSSLKDKTMILGALGYFILPADVIPDILPMGFSDDMAALLAVYNTVKGSLNPIAHQKAGEQIREWFEDANVDEFVTPEQVDNLANQGLQIKKQLKTNKK